MGKRNARLLMLALLCLLLSGCTVTNDGGSMSVQPALPTGQPELSNTLQILIFLTSLSLIPTILIMTTGFIRIVVVLSVARSAIGMAQLPPNQVIIGLALVLTVFVMGPTLEQMNEQALQPFLRGEITQTQAFERGIEPLRKFMFKQVRQSDLALFIKLGKLPRPNNQGGVPTQVLVPAFVLSELRTAFQMAFVIYVPFLVIDMVVGTALMSMGMMMLPPTVVSLPFKLLLFVLVDGWRLIAESLILSFH